MKRLGTGLLLTVFAAAPAAAQNGDQQGEEQPPLPADLVIPPAPALSAADELATFQVAPGHRVELVAAEPLVRDPVQIAFDPNGRMFVVEMSGYMRDVDATGEAEPVGSIALLDDTDGDGRMDRRTVFADGLVLPRALAPARGGVLVIAPPELLFLRDTDGDGVADERQVVDTGLEGIYSPEHAINGLIYTFDDAYHCARADWRYAYRDGKWIRERTAGGGQWGLSQDETGRMFFNTNSVPLFADLYPSQYAVRNPNLGVAKGVAVRLTDDYSLRSIRINPGVNRGYREVTLRDDFHLRHFTAVCAPWVHEGDVFVCEPAANLVKRYHRENDGLRIHVEPYAGPGEYLASTDERFRPVNLRTGPDGSLYVVDMYRGVIQHRIFVTSWLRKQIEERGLEQPTGLGRIWRVVRNAAPRYERPALNEASWTELAEALSHPNPWWRDTARRLIVEEGQGDRDAIELTRAALGSESPLGRMNALWALHGIEASDEEILHDFLIHEHDLVRVAAVRVAEPFLRAGNGEMASCVSMEAGNWPDVDPRVRLQALLSLGEARTPRFDKILAGYLIEPEVYETDSDIWRYAIISGLYERELETLETMLDPSDGYVHSNAAAPAVRLLARAVVREGRLDRVAGLVDLMARRSRRGPPWQFEALVEGALAGRPKRPDGNPGYISLTRRHTALDRIANPVFDDVAPRARELVDSMLWPGREDVETVVVRPLTPEETETFERGRQIYAEVCNACHLASGQGSPGLAPPLRHSPWVLGSEEVAARIVMHGLVGPIEVDGRTWNLDMPAFAASDEDLAAILTYVRREWGHGAEPVTADTVRAVREAEADRGGPWTAPELEALGR